MSVSRTESVHHATVNRARVRLALLATAVAFTACSLNTPTDGTVSAISTPTSVLLASGGLQVGSAGGPLTNPVWFKVLDQFGIASRGATVTFTTPTGSGSASAATAVTNDTGYVSVTWTLGTTVGTDSLNAAIAGGTPVTALAIARAAAPATLTLVSGGAQSGKAGSMLAAPLVVKVTDGYGNPVPNVSVTWSSDANGIFAATTEITDAFGVAQNTYTLGPSTGRQNIVATVLTPGNTTLVSALFATGS